MENVLTEKEKLALREVGKPLGTIVDADVLNSLMEKSLVSQKLGGYVVTAKGKLWLSTNSR